ncbi:hypothetical protein C8R45DRAFT_1099417 [Mycena sanguinolenta]|nr:hypothetical protein C8R45DRAFT_1099417 [Mycena sanguinolenta]
MANTTINPKSTRKAEQAKPLPRMAPASRHNVPYSGHSAATLTAHIACRIDKRKNPVNPFKEVARRVARRENEDSKKRTLAASEDSVLGLNFRQQNLSNKENEDDDVIEIDSDDNDWSVPTLKGKEKARDKESEMSTNIATTSVPKKAPTTKTKKDQDQSNNQTDSKTIAETAEKKVEGRRIRLNQSSVPGEEPIASTSAIPPQRAPLQTHNGPQAKKTK